MQTDRLIAYTKFLTCQNLYSQLNDLINIPTTPLDEMGIKFNYKLNSDYKATIAFDIEKNISTTSELLSKIFLSSSKSNKEIFNSICSSLFNSYLTFIRIKSNRDESFIGVDLILNVEHEIFYNKDIFSSSPGEYLLARVIDIDNYKFLLNSPTTFDINIGPTVESSFKFFMENKYKNFHKNIRTNGKVNLKNSSMDLLFSLYYLLESLNQLDLILDEDDDYSISYLPILNLFDDNDKKYVLELLDSINFEDNLIMDDLVMIYNRFFRDRGINFSDIKNFNFLEIFNTLSVNGDFKTSYDLIHSIILLMDIYDYLRDVDEKFNKPFEELKEIIDSIFLYKNNLLQSTNGIYSDENTLNILYNENIEFENNKLVRYFVQFINFFFLNVARMSKNSKKLTNKTIKNLLEYFNLSYDKESRNISLKDYPILNWFFNISLEKEFLVNYDSILYIGEKYQEFMYLEAEFKYNFMIYNIFSEINHNKDLENFKNLVVTLFKEIKNNKINLENVEDNKAFIILLKSELIYVANEEIKLSNLGEKIFNYYFNSKSNITNIGDYLN